MVSFFCCDTPIGIVCIGTEDGYVVSVRRIDTAVPSTPSPLSDLAASQILAYFSGSRKNFDFPFKPAGTPFQKAVWQALLEIPYGETRTYSQIAAAIGNIHAARAVGMACNRNPMWIVIPCHRVVGKHSDLTGYAGGLEMKHALLELEQQT